MELACNYAKKLKGGEIIGLIGDLGAGKTVFAKGLARGLGAKNVINSPTFVLMKIHSVRHKNIKRFIHIDAYRIKSAEDITAIGAGEYFNRPDTVTVIEWADKIKKILPITSIKVKIEYKTKNQRLIKFTKNL